MIKLKIRVLAFISITCLFVCTYQVNAGILLSDLGKNDGVCNEQKTDQKVDSGVITHLIGVITHFIDLDTKQSENQQTECGILMSDN